MPSRWRPRPTSPTAWAVGLVLGACFGPREAWGNDVSRSPDGPPAAPTTIVEPPSPTAPPLRHSGKRLYWDPGFDRMDEPEMVFTGVAASIALTTYIVHPLHTGWQGGILFDDQVRALRAPTYNGQLEARSFSDLGLALLATYPLLVDSLIVAYWYRGSDDVALQMTLIDGEAIAVTAALQGTANVLAGRARPYAYECGTGVPSNTTDCATQSLDRSFFSGHTSGAFTAASLICAHHLALNLFDSVADPLTCVGAYALATTVGTLRIVGDAHYFSDVFVGAVVGTAVGLGIPLLHHYKRAATDSGPSTSSFQMALMPGPTGAQLTGTF